MAGGLMFAGGIMGKIFLDATQWNKTINKILFRDLPRLSAGITKVAMKMQSAANSMMISGALISAGIGLGVKQFVKAADTADNLRMRLNVLLGSVEEGNKLFNSMSKLAGTVPQEFEKIMQAATSLTGALKGGREEVEKWMPVLLDLQAVSGLTMEQVTGNFIRALSAGIAAADLFRERGITTLLGFTALVQFSAEETATQIWKAWNAAGSRFRGTTEELAKTWSGMMSMMADKWFIFRIAVMKDTGIWDTMKKNLGALNLALNKNWGKILDWIDVHKVFVRRMFFGILAIGGFSLALIALGLTLKIAAFGLSAFAVVLKVIPFLLSPIGLGIAALVSFLVVLRTAWKTNFLGISDITNNFWKDFDEGNKKMIDDQQTNWDLALDQGKQFFVDLFNIAWSIAAAIGLVIDELIAGIKNPFKEMIADNEREAKVLFGAINTLLNDPMAAGDIENFWKPFWEKAFPDEGKAAESGKITGRMWAVGFTKELNAIFEKDHFKDIGLSLKFGLGGGEDKIGGFIKDFKDAFKELNELFTEEMDKINSSLNLLEAPVSIFARAGDAFDGLSEKANAFSLKLRGQLIPNVWELHTALKELSKERLAVLNTPGLFARAGDAFSDLTSKAELFGLQLRAKLIPAVEALRLKNAELAFQNDSMWGQIKTTMKEALDIMRGESGDFAIFIANIFMDMASSIENSFSQMLQSVITKEMSVKEAFKAFFEDVGRSIIKMTADTIARRIAMLIIGEKAEQAIKLEGAEQSLLIDMWKFGKEKALDTASLVWTTLMAAKELAIDFAAAVKSVAIDMWKATAKFIEAHAGVPYVGLATGLAFAAAATAAVAGGAAVLGSFLGGTDYVPATGAYILHEGEEVKTRSEVAQAQDGPIIQIHNHITPDIIAAAMSQQAGRNVIINVVGADMASSGLTRTASRTYGR